VTEGPGQETRALDPLGAVRDSLDGLLRETGGRMGMLMDGSGAVILETGATDGVDRNAFACLTVSHLGATKALASLVGEEDFRGLCHQGEHTSIFVADVADRAILSILFDGRRPVGQVSQEGRRIVSNLEGPVRRLLGADAVLGGPLNPDWAEAARDEIDRIFVEGA
jgi:predicted regulator of Ras-like GTPase activity (Roadblock/LC7/MglB family)